jgi:ESS family glutamate:Na+ symporter
MKAIAAGGKSLAILVCVAAVFLVFQNTLGVSIALLNGSHPAYGLLAGSISFAGGHGTAVAWGAVAEAAGFERAGEIGLAFATFGLVAGGLVGGPIARRLMRTGGIEGSVEEVSDDGSEITRELADPTEWIRPVLATLLALALCVSLGDLVNRYLFIRDVRLPGFLTAMFIGILVTNFADTLRRPLAHATIDRFGEVSLHIFLAMSMMAIELWTLDDMASVIMIVLVAQVLLMTVFAVFVVFRFMGSDYDAVVIAAGFVGMGLGATPVAIANMNAVTHRYGPSTKAFLVVPLVGAFFIDILNAGTINVFIDLIRNYLV